VASTDFDVYTSAKLKESYAYVFSINKDSVNVTIGPTDIIWFLYPMCQD